MRRDQVPFEQPLDYVRADERVPPEPAPRWLTPAIALLVVIGLASWWASL